MWSVLAIIGALGCGRIGFDADSPAACSECVPGIYRSVGPGSTLPIATGTGNTLVVSGTHARFTAMLPDRVGVGDVIQYDSDGDGAVDALAFVHGRVSATELVVADATGANPTATRAAGDQSWSIFRAYTSLDAAARGVRNTAVALGFDSWTTPPDLVALATSWHIACYGDASDVTTTARFQGWNTSEVNYLRIFTPHTPAEVGVTQRHAGRWDPTKYNFSTAGTGPNNVALQVDNVDVRIEGLQIFVNASGSTGDLSFAIDLRVFDAARTARISSCILHSNDLANLTTLPRGIKMDAAQAGPRFYAWNNVIYDFGGNQPARGIELTGAGATAYLYNNTLTNVSSAIQGNSAAHMFVIKNTFLIACGGSCLGQGTYMGSTNVGIGFDAKGIGVAPATDTLTDYLVAPDDLHIAPAAAHANELVDRGLDLYADPDLGFATDVDGDLRGTTWSIGADEP